MIRESKDIQASCLRMTQQQSTQSHTQQDPDTAPHSGMFPA
jgi:hypothetical protein